MNTIRTAYQTAAPMLSQANYMQLHFSRLQVKRRQALKTHKQLLQLSAVINEKRSCAGKLGGEVPSEHFSFANKVS